MGFKLDMQTKSMIRKLGKRGNALQIVAAETLNEANEDLGHAYKEKLKRRQRLRAERFTLGAVRSYKANPIRRSGEPRPLHKINAVTGVMKMRGGAEHYLASLEKGVTKRGRSKTKNRVPVPLQRSRTSNNEMKPVAGQNRLLKGDTQTLRLNGRAIGVRGDGFRNPRKRFGAIYGAVKSGRGRLSGDPKKPFYFFDNQNDFGIFKFFGKTMRKIRSLDKSTTRTKSRPNFEEAVKQTRPENIKREFVKKAAAELSKWKD